MDDRIPDLIKIGAIPSEFGQKLHTDVIFTSGAIKAAKVGFTN